MVGWKQKGRGERVRDRIHFKDIPPMTYFLQVSPTFKSLHPLQIQYFIK
jgi:hypothetical protein